MYSLYLSFYLFLIINKNYTHIYVFPLSLYLLFIINSLLFKFCDNTHTQYIRSNINIPDSDNVITAQHQHVDRKILSEILQKGTWGSFRDWSQQDIDFLSSLVLLTLCPRLNKSYGSQITMCKTLTLGLRLTFNSNRNTITTRSS